MAVSVATVKPEQRNLAGIFACDEQLVASLAGSVIWGLGQR